MKINSPISDYHSLDDLFFLSLKEVTEVLAVFRYVYEFKPILDVHEFSRMAKRLEIFRSSGSAESILLVRQEQEMILQYVWWFWITAKKWTKPIQVLMNRFLKSMTLERWAVFAEENQWEKAGVQIRDYQIFDRT